MLLYFFFQAEDGIRDVAVTGVQTCALPISSPRWKPKYWRGFPLFGNPVGVNLTELDGTVEAGPEVAQTDRKSVVEGKSVDLGGRRIIKKKKYDILVHDVAV